MKLAAEGHATALLTLTRGDKGRWFGKDLGSWSPGDLAAERTREWQVAVRGFHRAAIATEFAERGAAHQAARLYFNASPYSPDVPFVAMTPTHTVDIKEFDERKAQAFESHKTQFKDRERFYEMLKRRAGREYFHLAIDRRATVPTPDGSLFP